MKWTLSVCILIAAMLIVSERILEKHFRDTHAQDLQLQTTRELNTLTAELGSVINSNLSLLQGLAAHISIYPDINQSSFTSYAHALFRQQPLLVSIAAAPDFVVSLIYPLDANRAVLGLDYTQTPDQWRGIEQLKRPGHTLMAGPVMLVQGGEGVIARTAVFTLDNQFWGIVSAPMYTADLYALAGLNNDALNIDIAIRGRDGQGKDGEIFYGNPLLFDDTRSVLSSLSVGDGTWELAAQPQNGWHSNTITIPILRGGTIVMLLLLLILTL
ncbi:MAG TPA: CHASE domain-containing protein, partial [Cellvibrionaceae bacterium]